MVTTTLLVTCYLLPHFGFAALVCVWWPNRKSERFSSVPWIIAAYFIGFFASLLQPPIAALFPDWTKTASSGLLITQIYCVTIITVASRLINFVILWMLSANLAFLMNETSAGNVISDFFVKMHSHQNRLGRCLILCSLLPTVVFLFMCFYGCPPQYNK